MGHSPQSRHGVTKALAIAKRQMRSLLLEAYRMARTQILHRLVTIIASRAILSLPPPAHNPHLNPPPRAADGGKVD